MRHLIIILVLTLFTACSETTYIVTVVYTDNTTETFSYKPRTLESDIYLRHGCFANRCSIKKMTYTKSN